MKDPPHAGDPLPEATLASIRQTRLALKGRLETPSGGGHRSSNVRLREEFKLDANLRPALTITPGGRFDTIDLVVVRENLEGLYIGHEHFVQIDGAPHAVATGRKKVTIVHKANIMKALSGIFLETGLGVAPGANIGADASIFEAGHGSAPDIAGQDKANPAALLLAAAMMLDPVKWPDLATRRRRAIHATLNIDRVRTGDLGGTAGTKAFTAALVSRITAG